MWSWHPYYLSTYLSFQSVSHSICLVIHVNLVVTEGDKINPEIFFLFFFLFCFVFVSTQHPKEFCFFSFSTERAIGGSTANQEQFRSWRTGRSKWSMSRNNSWGWETGGCSGYLCRYVWICLAGGMLRMFADVHNYAGHISSGIRHECL